MAPTKVLNKCWYPYHNPKYCIYVFAVQDVNDKVTILENTINDLLDTFAPYKTFKIKKPNSTPWLTDEIKQVMNKRDMFKHNFNLTGNKTFQKNYKELRNKVTGMMRQSQKNMFNETINSKVKDSKDFYKTAKKLNIISDKTNKVKVNFSAQTLGCINIPLAVNHGLTSCSLT